MAYVSSSYYTFIVRIQSDGTQNQNISFLGFAAQRSFILRSDETSYYFWLKVSGIFTFLKISTLDGSTLMAITDSGLASSYSDYTWVVINPSNTILYFGVGDSTQTSGTVWWMGTSLSQLKCIVFTGIKYIRSIAYIGDNDLFYTSIESSGVYRIYMGRIQ